MPIFLPSPWCYCSALNTIPEGRRSFLASAATPPTRPKSVVTLSTSSGSSTPATGGGVRLREGKSVRKPRPASVATSMPTFVALEPPQPSPRSKSSDRLARGSHDSSFHHLDGMGEMSWFSCLLLITPTHPRLLTYLNHPHVFSCECLKNLIFFYISAGIFVNVSRAWSFAHLNVWRVWSFTYLRPFLWMFEDLVLSFENLDHSLYCLWSSVWMFKDLDLLSLYLLKSSLNVSRSFPELFYLHDWIESAVCFLGKWLNKLKQITVFRQVYY